MAFTGDYTRTAHVKLSLLGCDALVTCSPLVRLGDKGDTVIRVELHNPPEHLNVADYGLSFEATVGDKLIQDENMTRFRVINKTTFEYLCADQVHSFVGTINVAYFVLKSGTKRVTTQNFTLHSLPNAETGTDGLKESYVSVIDDLIETNKDAIKKAQEIEDMINKNQVVKKSGDTMTGDLKMDKAATGSARYLEWLIGGNSTFKIGLNSQNNFIFFDTKSNSIPVEFKLDTRSLQINSSLIGGFNVMSDTNLAKKTEAQMLKITTDIGGQTISAANATDDILQLIIDKGRGFNTIYCSGVVTNSTPSKASWRGHSFINSTGFGYIFAKDFKGNLYTNYLDSGNWLGWVLHADAALTQNVKLTEDNGKPFDAIGKDCNALTSTGKYFGNNLTNSPDGSNAYFLIETFPVATNNTSWVQHATRWSSPQMYYRSKVNNNDWSSWKQLADDDKVLKKAGDTMTGSLTLTGGSSLFDTSGSGIITGGGASTYRWRMYQAGGGELSFVPSATIGGSDWDWGKAFRIKPDGSTVTPKDGTRNIGLLNGATNPDTTVPPRADRRGNTVNVSMAVNRTHATNNVVGTLAAQFAPTLNQAFHVVASDGTSPVRVGIDTDGNITVGTAGKSVYINFTYNTIG